VRKALDFDDEGSLSGRHRLILEIPLLLDTYYTYILNKFDSHCAAQQVDPKNMNSLTKQVTLRQVALRARSAAHMPFFPVQGRYSLYRPFPVISL
jgi:hypothetical protein